MLSECKQLDAKMKDNHALLTVIVPIYNTALFLRRCIQSVINQTYKKLEILLIDDGSTDGSDEICNEYVKVDCRVKFFRKEHEGLMAVRKMGVEQANGEIIAFVDSDDWIEADMYQYMVELYEKEHPDLITSGLQYDWNNRVSILLDGVEEGSYESAEIQDRVLPRMIYDYKVGRRGITASVSNKLFRASLLKKVIPIIDTELTLGEDGAIMYCFVARANKITVTQKVFYHYVQREQSMIRQKNLESFGQIYRLEKSLIAGFKELNLEEKMKNQIAHYVKSFLISTVKSVYQIDLLDSISYIFPYESVPQGSKVILYGAGKMGQSYWKCLEYGEYATLVAWVDRDYGKKRWTQWDVESPEVIKNRVYDYIIIAIADEKMALEIWQNLLEFGVDEQKIIWKKRRRVS